VKALAIGGALALGALVLAIAGGLLVSVAMLGSSSGGAQPSSQAHADIPAEALGDYQAAALTCSGLSWAVLAGIGKVESDHGRSQLAGVHSGQNAAGAMGPMQFLQGTWDAFHLPGMTDVYALRDATFAAAHYLCANGAGAAERLRQAIWAYNHAWWYVDEVLGWAARYAADAVQTAATGLGRPGDPFAGACRPVVTQPYGPTTFAGEPVINGQLFHTGIDLACPGGVPVHSLTDGVAHVTLGPGGGGYGSNVVVEIRTQLPGDLVAQRYFVRYAHLETVVVADGAVVHGGDLVGLEGSTGFSTGPHLHFEVDRGAAVATSSINPAPLLEVS
jgi:murein DD-endopeptidase MepM/ murein hydrolase activator NlpD